MVVSIILPPNQNGFTRPLDTGQGPEARLLQG